MTCIIGLIESDGIYIGADSAGSTSLEINTRADSKVFIRDEFIFGFTDSFRMGQILQYHIIPTDLPGHVTDIHKWMCVDFISSIRTAFKETGYLHTENGREQGGSFLVGVRKRLFCVYGDFQVAETIFPYNSIGSGKDIALGAMSVLYKTSLSPKEKISQSLMASESFNPYVRSPFIIKSIHF